MKEDEEVRGEEQGRRKLRKDREEREREMERGGAG